MHNPADVLSATVDTIEYLQRQVLTQAEMIETLGVHLDDCRAEKTAQIAALAERVSMLEARLDAIHGATAPLDEAFPFEVPEDVDMRRE